MMLNVVVVHTNVPLPLQINSNSRSIFADRFLVFYIVFLINFFVCIFLVYRLDFAVTTKGQINFYGTTWKQLTSAAHQFDTLSALAFDETDETLYFNDQSHTNGSIFSLKLSSDENHRVEKLLQKTKDELIQGMAFDPLERILYWTDAKNKLIYQMSVDGKDVEPTILLKLDETKMPHGIAVDVCRRKLYWTNANHLNPSIERASLDGTNYEVLIDSDLFMPSGIVVDQYSKQIYWVDDRPGIQYSVESAKLDGTDRQNITQKLYNVPFNLAVDESGVFWTDVQQNAIWRISKNTSDGEQPQKVQSFTAAPKAIVVRNHLLSSQTENPDCKPVLDAIKMTLLAPKPSTDSSKSPTTDAMTQVIPKYFCLNDGVLNPKTDRCICPQEFKGDHCEIPICHNYCIEGTCYISSTGYAQCECHAGFIGERCEINLCNGYCLNGGRCDLENKEPVCHCGKPFYGRHCEAMDTTEMCNRFCNNEEIDAKGMDLISVCNK